MINALFFKDKNEHLKGFHIDGHAGDADWGYDIVCAGVSSAVELAANLATDFLGLDAKAAVKGGGVMFKLNSDPDGAGDKVLLALADHLARIAQGHPGRIKIEFRNAV
ncbi:MAG: ribosomal-processing cysteine protease Prp [Oscillospiraceae bacterium]